MEKRVFLAITLSFVVLLVYSSLLPKPKPIANNSVINTSISNPKNISESIPVVHPEQKSEINLHNYIEESNLYKIESDGLSLNFSKKGGFLLDVFDKAHNSPISIKYIGFVKEWSEYPFQASELPRGVMFDYVGNDGYGIKKIYRIKDDNTLELSIVFYNLTVSKIKGYEIFVGSMSPSATKDPISQRYYESSLFFKDMVMRKPLYGLKSGSIYEGNILWAGLRDRYFCTVFIPQISINKGVIDIFDHEPYLSLNIGERILTPESSTIEDQYKIYVGPQDDGLLKAFSPGSEKIVNFGKLDFISRPLLSLLSICHKLTKNWGISIILVTIFVYILLLPLSLKSLISMRKMQALQPKIEELRAKHKDNPQKLNMETMELYKREKVNPLGGCLPMLLQIPVFFALYQLLMRFNGLRGASFLWIKDLSSPDRAFIFKDTFPVIGNELNILPLLMAVAMFLQQKFSMASSAGSSATAEQQKIMTIIMPVLFGVLFYKMSSGLVLYWFVNSMLMFASQWKIAKIKQ